MISSVKDGLISVIVPVYNTAKYLPTCLDSLTAQTYRNVEIICVDNGSEDNSYNILKEYEKKHSNIIALSYPEGRQGDARNYGMSFARGQYIGFVDSDDYVDILMLEKMHDLFKNDQTEVVICNIETYYQQSRRRIQMLPDDLFQCRYPFTYDEYPALFRNLTICNKLFSVELIRRLGLEFPKGVLHEDQYFVILSLMSANAIMTTGEALYVYRKEREGSVSSNIDNDYFDLSKVMALLGNQIKMLNLDLVLFSEIKLYRYYVLYKELSITSRKRYYNALSRECRAIVSIKTKRILAPKEIREVYFMSILPYQFNQIYDILTKVYARLLSLVKKVS